MSARPALKRAMQPLSNIVGLGLSTIEGRKLLSRSGSAANLFTVCDGTVGRENVRLHLPLAPSVPQTVEGANRTADFMSGCIHQVASTNCNVCDAELLSRDGSAANLFTVCGSAANLFTV